MKYRAPRKKKKIAKKIKAANDAMIMVRTAMITAQSYIQLAIVAVAPIPYAIGASAIGLKSLRVVEITMNAAKAIAASMNEIKHWTYFVPNYRRL